MYDNILVPTDGSSQADAAAAHAFELATAVDATVHLLYVVDSNIAGMAGDASVLESLEEAGDTALQRLSEMAADAGVEDLSRSQLTTAPHTGILEYSRDNDVDLIVMGTHGRTGLERYLVGSVTEKVVRLSDVPVLTVRSAEND